MVDIGDSIGRYRIEECLGEGGMGKVFRAHDEQLGRRVAIKLVRMGSSAGAEAEARLLREARAAAALEHPGAVAIYDVGEHDGEPYIVMEFIEGSTLRDVVREGDPPVSQRLEWLRQMASALSAAHARGLVHRDIKPDNVMVRPDGTIKVVDFGIARPMSVVDPNAPTATSNGAPPIEALTAEGVQVGTIHYMAPEQVRGHAVDGRTDQFAWGVCAYELLTGRQPWSESGTALSVAASILTDEPAPAATLNRELSPRVTRIVERAMSKRAEDRFASMDELIEQLDAAMHERDEASEVDLRRYSSEQMRLVIDRALRQPSTDGARFSHDELVAAAREIGVDDEALDQALSELEDEADDAAESEPSEATAALLPGQPGWWNEERRREAYKLIRHLLVFAVVNTAMWLVFHAGWIRWMLFGWGMGLALHAVNVVMPKRDEDKKKKRRQREGEQKEKRARRAERRRERQQRRHPERGDKRRIEAEPADLERAAELLRDTSERRRQRLAPVDEPAREREAELEAELEAKRRRRTPSTR